MKKIFKVILIFIWIYLIAVMFITSHESIHYYIFIRHGVGAKVNYDFFPIPKGVVLPIGNYTLCNDFCKFQHALNDMIGYNLVVFITFLFGLYLFNQFKNEN